MVVPGQSGSLESMNYDILVNCMHCGLCLPHCPTFALTGNERSSPRGRIRLMKAVADGQLPMSRTFIDEMDFCLDCQACETACPAGVRYGSLVETARFEIAEAGHEGILRRLAKGLLLRWALVRRSRLHVIARLIRFFDRSGLRSALRQSGLLRLISAKLESIEGLTPPISPVFSSLELPRTVPAKGKRRFKVGFLTGCVMDVSFAEINHDTVEVLRHHGCEVVTPPSQECCGSLHAHNGERATARLLAERNLQAFMQEDLDYVIMNSSGCGAFMKEYAHLFENDPSLKDTARQFSAKVKDITEFLTETGFHPSAKASPFLSGKTVTYHDACHLVHTQKISGQPRQLIAATPGIVFREFPESTWCCGSAGIYNITRHEDSMQLLERKIRNVVSVNPEIVVTGNPGCMIQIQHGLRSHGKDIALMHTSTFLRHACAI